jgi:hypothetical protein
MTRYTKFDLKKEFLKFFNEEQDDFELRSEKFYVYCEAGIMREKRILEWLEEAYIAGAKSMAQDTLDILGDYACALAGCKKELIGPEEVYDKAHISLMAYYTKVLDNYDKVTDNINKITDKI